MSESSASWKNKLNNANAIMSTSRDLYRIMQKITNKKMFSLVCFEMKERNDRLQAFYGDLYNYVAQ